jgi:ATP-dependent Clp protease protease subunit
LRVKKMLEEIMAKNTGQKLSKIHIDMERDFWMTAEEAHKYGLVDKIIDSRKLADTVAKQA